MHKRGMVGAVLGIVAVALVLVGLLSVGWVTGYAGVDPVKVDIDWGLFAATLSGVETQKFKYTDDELKDSKVAEGVGTPRIMIIVGLVLGILFFILGLMAALGKMSGTPALALGVLAGLIILVGALMAVVAIKDGIVEDFEGAPYSFGNGGMFFLTLIAAILMFVAGGMMAGVRKAAPAVPAPTPPPPA